MKFRQSRVSGLAPDLNPRPLGTPRQSGPSGLFHAQDWPMVSSNQTNNNEPYFPEPLIRQQAKRVIEAYRLPASDQPDIEQYIRMRITQG